uniref:Uncharacterized protein n=1 Tax=Mustela putorius furo TaxID=9669 RepID=M3YLN7_MUSPF
FYVILYKNHFLKSVFVCFLIFSNPDIQNVFQHLQCFQEWFSHYISTGPEFNRVLFNFGGRSPLILYYLKMHELAGISKAPRQTKIKLTEISQEPYPFISFALMLSISKIFKTTKCH